MRRIFGDFAYGDALTKTCFWRESVPDSALKTPAIEGGLTTDVAIIGAGFTGLSAALHLAEAGVDVIVLDAHHPGWGASGRNGGFCCLGGAKASDAQITRRFGQDGRLEWRRTEAEAIKLTEEIIHKFGIDCDTHSNGETVLAHSAKAMTALEREVTTITNDVGVAPTLHDTSDLNRLGMNGPFHGGLTVPLGIALNPKKYLQGLLQAAQAKGAQVFSNSAVTKIAQNGGSYALHSAAGQVTAKRLIVATNGYSSEDIPEWMAGRYMPAQSNVLVTRPLSRREQEDAGWRSSQMAYDTRHMLHYFRLMPDGRFLFGRRGGLRSSPRSESQAIRITRRHFDTMFPAWKHVESPYNWSGMVCLSPTLMPFCGPIPGMKNAFAGFAYHGNGVAMGSYTGALLAQLVDGGDVSLRHPKAMQTPPGRFPLGRARRLIMPFAYAAAALHDHLT